MADEIKAVNLGSLDSKTQKDRSAMSEDDKLIIQSETEYQPNHIKASWEKTLNNGHDAWIILTKDRPGNRSSGFGGRGDFSAGAIDLVVGKQQMVNATPNHWCDPNFKADAARIYISQKTDIDENFNLCDGTTGKPLARAGIGIKADVVRVVGREGIKLVTSTDGFNSKGAKIKSRAGIDLIAGNDDANLQPLVLGDNLVDALESLVEYVNAIVETFASFVRAQMQTNLDQSMLNNAILSHTHPFAGVGGVTSPSIAFINPQTNKIITTIPQELFNMASDTVMSTVNTKTNLIMYKSNMFTPKCFDFILSKNNNTN